MDEVEREHWRGKCCYRGHEGPKWRVEDVQPYHFVGWKYLPVPLAQAPRTDYSKGLSHAMNVAVGKRSCSLIRKLYG